MFNANDYTTRQLLEMEFQNVPNGTQKENLIAEALQLVEECAYSVGEAANEVRVSVQETPKLVAEGLEKIKKESPLFGIPFDNEPDKIRDMKKISKKDFLASYSYLTEADYDATANKF